ncbi:MAG: DUF2156 domain-containing protein [Microbacterium sp.]|uniref:bifunctional lysylphosphatidylglycerol flippase/synthetase MprF n=1 Tax=Microbacterium sp. TaxID=51671 RepID=UPI001AC3A96B|nr:DUF2156 domain-containing protein [Microbacterium sp.]MBN9178000.1 DUF2156 domain-containing protein [Microbacterium sp.]
MTDAQPAEHAESIEHAAPTRRGRALRFVRTVLSRVPATWLLIGVLLGAGLITGALWRPIAGHPFYEHLAYGLPSFEKGKWWTPLSGTFLLDTPIAYPIIILGFWGMAYLEWKRGTRVALAYFFGGQLFAILGAAFLLWSATTLAPDWAWAAKEAASVDVGPSGGLFACIAAAITVMPSPWRLRGWLVVLAFVIVNMMFWGSIDDLEHLLAVLLVLVIDRSLRPQRSTVREQRLIVFIGTLMLGALTIVTQIVPTYGPFGETVVDEADAGWVTTAISAVAILLVANGLRRGRRWAWVVSIVVASLNIFVGFVILVAVGVLGWDDVTDTANDGSVGLALATAVIWAIYLVYLVLVRGVFRARPRHPLGVSHSAAQPTVDDVKDLIRATGGGTLSWMATWDGNDYLRTSSGIVPYQRHAGVAIALADPLGPVAGRAESVVEFVDAAQHAGLIPAFFSASEATRDALPEGWRSLVVADDSIVDLEGLQFTGKRWNNVRTAMNKAGREEITFRLTRFKDEPWGVQAQIRAISEMWVGDKGLPEMGFTLGSLTEAADPEVRLALALSPAGDVDGFLSWLPVYGGGGLVEGWTLDLMRRREGGFGSVMEFLIGSSARQFSDEGARIMSLSGAPLAHDYPEDAGVIAVLADRLGDSLEPVYGFASLHRFKEKFNPRYETMYLLYRDEADIARIAAALTRAFLPDATLRQFAGAGIELVAGR